MKADGGEVSVQVGTRIGGRFAVQALLGSGGMADVYRVLDEVSGEELALKRLRAQTDVLDPRPRSLFEREFHTLAQISHPCVIQVCDYGVDDLGAYYTMELVQGQDLHARGRLPWREACGVLRDIASALAALHARRWLHRDLSPRNVMCTAGGAKLIDFGVMAPMGLARGLVGTPPLVPPEALQQQSLDARADLFALGALGYWVLTGRHAYPARDFDDLRDRWRSVPRPPDKLAPDLPVELSELVLELLSLDRGARPSSASEVIERLTNLIGEPVEARPEAGVAYLSTPRLVGRDQALQTSRARLLDSLRGRGSALLIEGETGSGRSRFLDACVLEAKLLGAVVLRGDASDGARGDYGLASALGEQLLRALPEMAIDAARLRGELLGSVIPGLAEQPEAPEPPRDVAPADGESVPPPASAKAELHRRHVQTALRDWFLSIARNRRIVIAVDDFDHADEPSAAWLAALAHKGQRRQLVVVAATNAQRRQPHAALELLRATSSVVELTRLSAAQTETLVASLFGDARHIASVAHRVFEASQGVPRRIMELCEHLVQRGRVRYAAGAWILPEELGEDELPASIDVALGLRLLELDADARELADALALTEPQALPLDSYALLLPGREPASVYRALDALVAKDILEPEGERYRFAHPRSKVLLEESLDAARTRELHARLVQAHEPGRITFRLAYHLMHSGDEGRAIAVMLERRQTPLGPDERLIALLELAVPASERLGLSSRRQLTLRIWLTVLSGTLGHIDVFHRFAPGVLSELEAACGLTDYRALGDGVPAQERLQRALTAAQQRHESAPRERQSLAPVLAIRELCRVSAACSAFAGMALELGLLERLPSLEPLAVLSPAVSAVQMLTEGLRHHQAGRMRKAWEVQLAVLARIEQPDQAGLDPVTHRAMRFGVLYSVGILEALSGNPMSLERVSQLREQPGYRSNAWRVHVICHSMQGDMEEARRCERRAELMRLQDGAGQVFPSSGLYATAVAQWLADDLDGVRQLIEPMRAMAERFPGWQVPYQLTLCHYYRLKGDLQSAFAIAEVLVHAAPIGSHIGCCWAGAVYIGLLAALGRAQEAADFGLTYLAQCRAQAFDVDDSAIAARSTAEALVLAGRHAEALAVAEEVLQAFAAHGVCGLRLGAWYEVRARIALAMRDEPAFNLWAERCGDEYTRNGYPALCAKYGRLLQKAQREALRVSSPPEPSPARWEADPERDGFHATVYSRMNECVDALERARCALLLLLEHTGASEGHLYGLLEGRLVHLVSEPAARANTELGPALEPLVKAELRATETTAVRGMSSPPPARDVARESELAGLHGMVLAAAREGETVVAAAAALAASAGYKAPPSQLLQTLARSLLDNDDVDPLTRLV